MAKTTVDSSSPLFIHPNENPETPLIPVVLNGPNYHAWSRAMCVALKIKNKLQFINGNLPKSKDDDATFEAWDRYNSLVIAWINQTLNPSISKSVIWLDTAKEIWENLRRKFHQADAFRNAAIQGELYNLHQGEQIVSEYFTRMENLWLELESFRPTPQCVCAVTCSCTLIPTIMA
jgi:hypothetical protein